MKLDPVDGSIVEIDNISTMSNTNVIIAAQYTAANNAHAENTRKGSLWLG